VEYAALRFNRERLNKFIYNGILEFDSLDYLNDCDIKMISGTPILSAVHFNPRSGTGIKLVTLSFKCYYNKSIVDVGGYWRYSFTSEDMVNILIKLGMEKDNAKLLVYYDKDHLFSYLELEFPQKAKTRGEKSPKTERKASFFVV